jgi:hypothetical protein
MKIKIIVISVLSILGLLSQATAVNVVYITGSSAVRNVVFNTIVSLPGWSPAITGVQAARGGAHANGDDGTYMLFHGTYNGANTYINCIWNGSDAGIASVTAPGANPVYFLLTTVGGINSGQPLYNETNLVAQAPDFCFADNSQATSLTLTPSLTAMGTNVSIPGAVGVVPFVWLKNNNSNPLQSWINITNISISQVRRLLSGPVFPALLTGAVSDTNQYIYLVGGSRYSGAHVNCVLEAHEPLELAIQQFSIGGFPNSIIGTVGSHDPNDPNALDSNSKLNSGYSSCGDIANALSCDGSCHASDPFSGNTGWIGLGYLGMADAARAKANGAVYLTYNGVNESDGAVEEGQYDFWNYEFFYGRVGLGAGYQWMFGNDLALSIPMQFGGANPNAQSTGININFMHAGKPSDAGDPGHFGQIF